MDLEFQLVGKIADWMDKVSHEQCRAKPEAP
jgi:hypothetical protein